MDRAAMHVESPQPNLHESLKIVKRLIFLYNIDICLVVYLNVYKINVFFKVQFYGEESLEYAQELGNQERKKPSI